MDFRDTQDQRNCEAIVQEHMDAESQQPVSQEPSLNEVEMWPLDDYTTMSGIEASSSTLIPPVLSSSLSMPNLSPVRSGMRRSRVEDDHDDERDRRHPAERLGDPSRSASPVSQSSSEPHLPSAPWHSTRTESLNLPLPLPGISSFVTGPSDRTGASAPSGSRPFRFFQHMMPPNHPNNPNTAATASASQQQPSSTSSTATGGANGPTFQRNPVMEGFAMVFDDNRHVSTTPIFSGSDAQTRPTHPENDTFDPPTQGQEAPANEESSGQPQPAAGSQHSAAFAELLARLGLLAALNGLAPYERDVDDPERAKKLVAGLEEVPSGLVRRLERVGGTGGGMGEELTSGGDSGCAICWDKLLLKDDEVSEDSGEKTKEQTKEQTTTVTEEKITTVAEEQTTTETEEKYRTVVSLPCAHVFHADCLIPWFSRPKQATCPTCRFNIDPENLTYIPRAQRRQQQGNRAQTQTPAQDASAAPRMSPQPEAQESNANPAPPNEAGGFSFPLFFSGTMPGITIPVSATQNPDTQNPSSNEGGQPHPQLQTDGDDQQPQTQDRDGEDDENGARHFVTIAFDLYIGQGPPPINRPAPPASEEPETSTVEAEAGSGGEVEGTARPDTQSQGSRPPNQRSVPLGSGFIPIPLGRGALGDIYQRMFGQMGERRAQTNQALATGGTPVFGPERPPAPEFAPAPASNSTSGSPRRDTAAPFVLPFGFGSGQAPTQPQSQSQPQSPTQPAQQPLPQTTTQAFILEDFPLMDLLNLAFRSPGGADGHRPQSHRGPAQAPRRPKTWAPPPAPGLTLRQRIEKKEQEAGWRCCDFSCGVGPSDEEPLVHVTEEGMKQLNIRDDAKSSFVCPHTFHSSCLVSSERVSLALRDADVSFEVGPEGEEEVEVSCPVCRGVGKVSREDWEDGVQALN